MECVSTDDRQYHRPLGEDMSTYKLQIEGFVDTIRGATPQQGATINDGIVALMAIALG